MNDLVKQWKVYAKRDYGYLGDENDPKIDQFLLNLLKELELIISQKLSSISPTVPANSAVGLIIQNGQIKTTPEDFENALRLIALKKQAQATVDTFDVDEYVEQYPIATKPMPTGDDHGGENGDPLDSQQTGLLELQVPKEPNKPPVVGMDDRIVHLMKIMKEIKV